MGGGGKGSKPKVEKTYLPEAPTPAPPPEQTAQAATVGNSDEGSLRHRDRDAKKRGTSALRIDLNVAPNAGTATPGGGGGLNIPKG